MLFRIVVALHCPAVESFYRWKQCQMKTMSNAISINSANVFHQIRFTVGVKAYGACSLVDKLGAYPTLQKLSLPSQSVLITP